MTTAAAKRTDKSNRFEKQNGNFAHQSHFLPSKHDFPISRVMVDVNTG